MKIMPYVETGWGPFRRKKFYYGDSWFAIQGMPEHKSVDFMNQLLLEKVLNGEQNTFEYQNMLANKKLMERNIANSKMEGGSYYCDHKWDSYRNGDIESDHEFGYKCVLCGGRTVISRITNSIPTNSELMVKTMFEQNRETVERMRESAREILDRQRETLEQIRRNARRALGEKC